MLQPLYDKILIDTNIEQEEQNSSGLILYEDKNQPKKAKVLAVGNGRPTETGIQPLFVKPGDSVLVPNFGGITIFEEGNQYIIIRESDLLGVIK